MKHVFILFLLMQVFSAKMFAQNTFTNYGIGRFGSEAFTTNNFKCIGVGKGNLIWAVTQSSAFTGILRQAIAREFLGAVNFRHRLGG